tara:strand:+ start:7191 stop:7553 length:363 start_codon:yes stop_codon:yes gene_type:complete
MLIIPVKYEVLRAMEPRLLPVVDNVVVTREVEYEDRVVVYATFDKKRSCEFKGLSWFARDGRRLTVVFEPDFEKAPQTRPKGDHVVGPWELIGETQLAGTSAHSTHRCHPLWDTITPFWP